MKWGMRIRLTTVRDQTCTGYIENKLGLLSVICLSYIFAFEEAGHWNSMQPLSKAQVAGCKWTPCLWKLQRAIIMCKFVVRGYDGIVMSKRRYTFSSYKYNLGLKDVCRI